MSKFGQMINACNAAAYEAERASKSDDLSRDLLRKTASGVPDIAGTNAMRMADLLADQGKATASKTAVQTAIKAYDTTDFIGKFYKLYDPKQSLPEKLKTLSGLVPDPAFGKNLLAQDMLKTAIAGLTATNQTALDNLVRELNAFSAQIARDNEAASRRAVEEAKAEQDRRIAERRSAEEAEKRRLAKQRRLAAENAARTTQHQKDTAPPPTSPTDPDLAKLLMGMQAHDKARRDAPSPNNSNDVCRPTPHCHTPQCIANCRWDNQFGYYPNDD